MSQASRGICTLCQRELSKSGMARHLEVCWQRSVSEEPAENQQPPQYTRTFHLVVEGRFLPMYWLHLEVATSTTLATLDRFLRDTWLECCGHLSAFQISTVHYCVEEGMFGDWGWSPRNQSMQVALEDVLRPGETCSYEYDFGSTTELRLKVLAAREKATRRQALRFWPGIPRRFSPATFVGKPRRVPGYTVSLVARRTSARPARRVVSATKRQRRCCLV